MRSSAHIHRHSVVILFGFGLLAVFALANSAAAIVIDGRYDPGEGYGTALAVAFEVEGAKDQPNIPVAELGQLYIHQDPSTGNVSILFIQPKTLVDNTYGANSIGWGSEALSGREHKFTDLVNSDDARFVFTNGSGDTVLDITVDYIAAIVKDVQWGNPSVIEGPDGDVIAVGSSLDYNFNTLGHVLPLDSPDTDDLYTEDPSYVGWVYEVAYELQISGSLFGVDGLGEVLIELVHDSPNKIGKNKVFTDIPPSEQDVIPEPLTVAGLLMGIGAIGAYIRRK